mgnify:CR=1 FL=1
MVSDNRNERKTPPEDENDWAYIWRAVDRANKSWIVTGPIYDMVMNWKAYVAIAGFILMINSPKIIEALKMLVDL